MDKMLTFDTETTGLLRPAATELWLQPRIIEIYVSKLDDNFNLTDEFESYVNPDVPIPEEVSKITGICDDHVRNAPKFIEIYEELCNFFRGEDVIYAHNCTFDINMLVNSLRMHNLEYNFPWPSQHRCTVEISQCIENKRLSLEKLCAIAGVRYEKGHRAKNDVLMMNECIKWLHDQELI